MAEGSCVWPGLQPSPAGSLRPPWWRGGKEPACQWREVGVIPGSGRPPGEGNGSPLQYSCLESSMDRGAWWAAYSPWRCKRVRHHGATKQQHQEVNVKPSRTQLLLFRSHASLIYCGNLDTGVESIPARTPESTVLSNPVYFSLTAQTSDPLEKEPATHPVCLQGNFHGQRSLAGSGPWDSPGKNTRVACHLCIHLLVLLWHNHFCSNPALFFGVQDVK